MRIAFLGTGLLGYPAAESFLKAGHKLYIYNRTLNKGQPLENHGAEVCSHPSQAIAQAQCIVMMLADMPAIEDVLLSDQNIDFRDRTVIQMGTIAPQESVELCRNVNSQGGEYFECPVLGSKKEAQEANLILMVGSTQEQYDRWLDLLKSLGPHPRRVGDVGSAAALKLALNQLIASMACAFSLSLGIVERHRINPDDFMAILKESALYAPMFDKKLPRLIQRNFDHPNFSVRHLLKDVHLIADEAVGLGLNIEQLQGIRKILEKTMSLGWAQGDYSAVVEAINPREG